MMGIASPRDPVDIPDAAALHKLSLELQEISERMAQRRLGADPQGTVTLSTIARHLQKARRKREALFPDLFADAAWDLLLDLFAAREERRSISVSSACIAAAVPPTTALRFISLMEARGLVERRAHPHDGRRWLLSLSDRAYEDTAVCLAQFAQLSAHGLAVAQPATSNIA